MSISSTARRHTLTISLFALALLAAGGCATYVTPSAGISPSALSDKNIEDLLQRKPAAPFPARLAIARVAAANYHSYTSQSYGRGNFSVVTTRDVEREEDFQRLAKLPMVLAIAPMNRIVIPGELKSDQELRQGAAAVKADLLLVYTLDTTFRVKDHDIGPLGAITLGFLPNQEARVTCTASAAIYDVRTGYIYGLSEATAFENQIASAWTSSDAVDETRLKAERQAFEDLLGEFEKTWKTVVENYATKTTVK